MTEQELRDKIVNIAISTVWKDCYGDEVVIDRAVAEQFADALIDANIFVDIGTLKDEQQSMNGILTNMSSYMNYKLHELEHRAEVAQLIAERACELVFSEEINDEDWVNVIFNYKKEKGIREIGITTNILYDYLKDQAEKELAEEGKDE